MYDVMGQVGMLDAIVAARTLEEAVRVVIVHRMPGWRSYRDGLIWSVYDADPTQSYQKIADTASRLAGLRIPKTTCIDVLSGNRCTKKAAFRPTP